MSCIGKKYIFQNIDERINYDDVKEGIVYVCDSEKLAQLKCSCGCGDVIYINLIQETKPKWQVKGNSITPSVNRTTGCRSHFTITNGITH